MASGFSVDIFSGYIFIIYNLFILCGEGMGKEREKNKLFENWRKRERREKKMLRFIFTMVVSC